MHANRGFLRGRSGGRWFLVLGTLLWASAAPAVNTSDWPQFRGPGRDGKSTATGLLDRWPEEGPPLAWAVEDLGPGFASVVVGDGLIYTTGLEEETGYVYAYALDGRRAWRQPFGRGWGGGHPGTRTTPTLDDGHLYVMSGHGRVACLEAAGGQERWAVDLLATFGARQLRWGLTESLLVDGDRVICTPGGEKAGIVALDKASGQTVWACREIDEKSGYCSPILAEHGGRRLLVTLTASALVGLDPGTGTVLWRQPHDAKYGIHAVSPAHAAGRIYVTSGYGGERGLLVALSDDGTAVSRVWTEGALDCHHGGVVVHEGHIYGASDRNRKGKWLCLDLKSGTVVAETDGVGKGAVAYADGMLYVYGENGQVGLLRASPARFDLVSSFKVTRGEGRHWAHPAVAGGRLYIRHGTALMAYDIRP